MSSFESFRLVAGREVRESVRRRGFQVVVAILFLGALAAVIIPELVGDDGLATYDVGVDSSSGDGIEASLDALAERLEIEIETSAFDADDPATPVEDGSLDAVVVEGSPYTVYARSDASERLLVAVQEAVGVTALRSRLVESGVARDEASELLSAPPVVMETVGHDRDETRGVSALASVVLYIALLTVSIQVANSTAVEKSSRVSEVLVAIVRPPVLLFGKVVGVGLVSLIGVGALVLPILVRAAVGGDLPAKALPAVGAGVLWYVLGMALYATLAGALGALVERQEEAGTVMQPIVIALVAFFFVAQGAADSTLGEVLAIVPFSAPLVEPSRIALGVTSPGEVALSLGVIAVTIVAVLRFGATVYRRAIVQTGSRLRLRQVFSR